MPTITRSIQSLREAGFYHDVHIFAEPSQKMYVSDYPNTKTTYNLRKYGVCKNSHQAVDRFAGPNSEFSHIFIAQDDFIYNPNTFEIVQLKLLEEMDNPKFGYLCLFTDKRTGRYIKSTHRNKVSQGRMTLGALYIFSKESRWKIKSHKFYREHVFVKNHTTRRDCCVAETTKLLGLDARYHNPSLAAHIGQTSTIGHHNNSKSTVKTGFWSKEIDNPIAL